MKLNIKDEAGKTTVVPLTRDEITIGRKEGNTIRLTERNVSRTHARFLKKGEEIHVEDVSRYGTRVNGERITESRRVGAGDTIQIGDYLLSLDGVKAVEDVAGAKLAAAGAAAQAAELRAPTTPAQEKKKAEVEAAAKAQIAALKGEAKKDKKDLDVTGEVNGDELRKSRGAGKKRIGANHPTLVAVTTHLAGSEYPITAETMILGRTGENDLKVDHHSISRNHAKVVIKDGKVRMVDLQSKNGIRVNGEFWEESSLKSGDIIELGKVQFRFVEKGEEFIFRPEDYAESAKVEEKKKGGKGILLVLLLLGAGALAAVYFLVIAPPNDKPNVPNVPVAPTQPPPTSAATAPTVAPEVVTPVETVQAAQAPEVVTPPPVDNAATIRDLLEKANAAAGQRKWDDADKQLEMVLALDPEHAGGRALKAKVNAEKAVETAYGEAVAAQGKNDLPGAWQVLTTKLAGMPPDSVYAPQVSEMKGAIGKTLANKLIDEAKAAFAKKQWQEAINKSEAAQKIVPNVDGASDLITKAKKAKIEEAKKDAAKDPKKDPTTDPNEKSADELYKEARSMHNTDKAAALRLYEQAAAKGHVAAYRQIGSIKISMDTNAAINAYKKYLQLNPSAPDADAIREMITKLGGTP